MGREGRIMFVLALGRAAGDRLELSALTGRGWNNAGVLLPSTKTRSCIFLHCAKPAISAAFALVFEL